MSPPSHVIWWWTRTPLRLQVPPWGQVLQGPPRGQVVQGPPRGQVLQGHLSPLGALQGPPRGQVVPLRLRTLVRERLLLAILL